MAESYAHRWGQIIGDSLEIAIYPFLKAFADENDFYLDKKGVRTVRKGRKLTWKDINENNHDLDFVLEKDGTDTRLGKPVAFIETAWRRYTKHSRNKVQEIQGAIMPLFEKYKIYSPFIGVILAGEFTAPSITQLKSLGFKVLHFSYETVVAAFAKGRIDASSTENSTEEDLHVKCEQWLASPFEDRKIIAEELIFLNKDAVEEFVSSLKTFISRQVDKVFVIALHGEEVYFDNVSDAISGLNSYKVEKNLPLIKFEIIIRYNTGDKIDASLNDKEAAIDFLQKFA